MGRTDKGKMPDERTPLLQFPGAFTGQSPLALDCEYGDHHIQFCKLVGVKPLHLPDGAKYSGASNESLYRRATRHRRNQSLIYIFTATLSNTLLLTQVVLGAALTALGASDSSRVLITVFGALNTVIAGLVAYLKSRGQPMRARMYRDDLERVVDEIENSAVMWLGISKGVHGYDAIDIDDQVTVRSEVARLTRLYDRAVRTNASNDPDMYAATGHASDAANAALRSHPLAGQGSMPAIVAPPAPAPSGEAAAPSTAVPVPVTDPDESPATKAKPSAPSPTEPAKDKEAVKDVPTDDQGTKPEASSTPPASAKPADATAPSAPGGSAASASEANQGAVQAPSNPKDTSNDESSSTKRDSKIEDRSAADEAPKKESQSTEEPDGAK